MNKIILTFCIIGIVIAGQPYFSDYIAIGVCCALIISYAFIVGNKKQSSSVLSTVADHVYLLGYLYTISALLGIAVKFWFGYIAFSDQLMKILFIAGLKLSTTVVGLVTMLYLKTLAIEKENYDIGIETNNFHKLIEKLKEIDPNDLIRKLVLVVTESSKQDFIKLESGKTALMNTMVTMSGELEKLKSNFNQFSTQIKTSHHEMEGLKCSFENTSNSLLQLTNNINSIFNNVQVKHVNADINEFVGGVKQIKEVLDDFVRVIQIKIDNLNES